jgi:hypothetical protein
MAIMAGTPWYGYRFYGPFDNFDQAENYQALHLQSEDFWWIVDLIKEAKT